MSTYETIKMLCKERGIAVTALEKELGFGRGSIGKLRNSQTSAERLQKIADYFNVTVDYLVNSATEVELSTLDPRVFNRIISLCDKRGINQSDLEKELGFGKGTISKWKFNPNPSAEKLLLVANYFNVSTDFLLKGTNSNGLTEKDSKDIAKDLDSIMEKLTSGENGPASYNGEELSPEAAELFKDELEIALKRLKLINKEKYTPKKYKK